ncbi:hypothetical protein DV737_g1104, partial [Chaetothyriales sp. CBS 132003]
MAAEPKTLGLRKNGKFPLQVVQGPQLTVQTGKNWHQPKKAFRPTAGLTAYEKRKRLDQEKQAIKAWEQEIKEEARQERDRKIQAIKDRRKAKEEKERSAQALQSEFGADDPTVAPSSAQARQSEFCADDPAAAPSSARAQAQALQSLPLELWSPEEIVEISRRTVHWFRYVRARLEERCKEDLATQLSLPVEQLPELMVAQLERQANDEMAQLRNHEMAQLPNHEMARLPIHEMARLSIHEMARLSIHEMARLSIPEIGMIINAAGFVDSSNRLDHQLQSLNQVLDEGEDDNYAQLLAHHVHCVEMAMADVLGCATGLVQLNAALTNNADQDQVVAAVQLINTCVGPVMEQVTQYIRAHMIAVACPDTRWPLVSRCGVEFYHRFCTAMAALMKRDQAAPPGQANVSNMLAITRVELWAALLPLPQDVFADEPA